MGSNPPVLTTNNPDEILNITVKGLWKQKRDTPAPTMPMTEFLDAAQDSDDFLDAIKLTFLTLHNADQHAWDDARRSTYDKLRRLLQESGWTLPEFLDAIHCERQTIRIDYPTTYLHAALNVCSGFALLKLRDQRGIVEIRDGWRVAHEIDQAITIPWRCIIDKWINEHKPTVEPETRNTQIMPSALRSAHTAETQEELPLGLFAEQGIQRQLMIPGMINDDSAIVPAFPLDVYEASAGKPPERGGKGAPLPQRIWINALLALPYANRERRGEWKLSTTLRDIKEWAYPNDWRRNECLPRIQAALKDVHNMRVYWERRLWNIVQVFAIPAANIKLDDPLPLLVRLPDGMPGEGPMINVVILRLLGVQSAAQFRAWIKLAYIWDDAKRKNGGHRIFATRPKALRNNRGRVTDYKGNVIPNGNWNHKRAGWTGALEDNPAAERLPVFDDDGLIHLFFDNKPVSLESRRRRLLMAKQELKDMVAKGYIVLKELPAGVRILEPRPPESQTYV